MRTYVVVLGVMLLALAGCGGSEESGDEPTQAKSQSQAQDSATEVSDAGQESETEDGAAKSSTVQTYYGEMTIAEPANVPQYEMLSEFGGEEFGLFGYQLEAEVTQTDEESLRLVAEALRTEYADADAIQVTYWATDSDGIQDQAGSATVVNNEAALDHFYSGEAYQSELPRIVGEENGVHVVSFADLDAETDAEMQALDAELEAMDARDCEEYADDEIMQEAMGLDC